MMGTAGDGYEPGMEAYTANMCVLSEGAGGRGSLSKEVIAAGFNLFSDGKGAAENTALVMKKSGRLTPEKGKTVKLRSRIRWGWPWGQQCGRGQLHLPIDTTKCMSASWCNLNYENPYLSGPGLFRNSKRFKPPSPWWPNWLERRPSAWLNGARAPFPKVPYQVHPQVVFKGGRVLLGCSGRVWSMCRAFKGQTITHGLCRVRPQPEAAYQAIKADRSGDELTAYEHELRNGPVGQELKKVRNGQTHVGGNLGAFCPRSTTGWAGDHVDA